MSDLYTKFCKAKVIFREHGLFFTLHKICSYILYKFPRCRILKTSDAEEYIRYVEKLNLQLRKTAENENFIPLTLNPYQRKATDAKLIAWYLPQYYEIEVNNKFHGKGFTEWTNAARSIPFFAGHYQPHIPYDVGFYNLTMKTTLERQIELAHMYGIYGFCFDYYWFSGERIMEKPVELFLKNSDLDIHFCINWCMENWTQKWDGRKNGIIYELKLRDDDLEKFFYDLLPYLQDKRYICIDGRPVLMFYMCNVLPQQQFHAVTDQLRELVQKAGFPDFYIMLCTNLPGKASDWGGDALVEYPTNNLSCCPNMDIKGYMNPNFKSYGGVLDYKKFVENRLYWNEYKGENVFHSVLTNFDNSSRKGYNGNCWITANSTPDLYKKWLSDVINRNSDKKTADENIVFLLAWNEWAESAHLEPDLLYGYGYLQATKEAVEKDREPATNVIDRQISQAHSNGVIQIKFYIHCIESLGDIVACEPIARYLKKIEPACEIFWIVKKCFTDLLRFNPNVDQIIEVDYLGQSIDLINTKRVNEDVIVIDCHYDGRWCTVTGKVHHNKVNPQVNEKTYLQYGSLLSNFCLAAGLPALQDAPLFYLDPQLHKVQNLPARYVAIHCKAAEAIKDWPFEKWKQFIKYLTDCGYYVIELGFHAYAKVSHEKYLDFTNERNLQNIAYIIQHAQCFVGVDSGFAHIANCFGIPAVLLFGKYKNFEKPQMYTGNYTKPDLARILFPTSANASVSEIDVDLVKEAFDILRQSYFA